MNSFEDCVMLIEVDLCAVVCEDFVMLMRYSA